MSELEEIRSVGRINILRKAQIPGQVEGRLYSGTSYGFLSLLSYATHQGISFLVIEGVSDCEKLSIIVNIFNLFNFLDVLILEKHCIKHNLRVKLIFPVVVASIIFQELELSEIALDHFQVILWSGKMVTFSLNY